MTSKLAVAITATVAALTIAALTAIFVIVPEFNGLVEPGNQGSHASATPSVPIGYNSRIGYTLSVADDNIDAKWTVRVNSVSLYQPGRSDMFTQAGTHNVSINVTYHAIKGSVVISPLDWESGDTSSNALPAIMANQNGALIASRIQSGKSITGNVVLQISNTSSVNIAIYSFGLLERGSWIIPGDAG